MMKSNRLRSKTKSKSKVRWVGEGEGEEAVYTKVYEKVPTVKRRKGKRLYSPDNRRFESAVNFYPYDDPA